MAKVFCLMGPTAIGKTRLSIALSQSFDFEIINVDSAMIYRGMDIGTAKPTLAERQGVPHHLVDIKDPHQTYSAGEFCEDAQGLIRDIESRGKHPLMVGGTMMYFHALQQGMADLPESDPSIRDRLWQEGENQGWSALHARLRACDPDAADAIHPNDRQRIQRALEVFEIAGVPLSRLQKKVQPSEHDFVNMALFPKDRAVLHAQIAERVDIMLVQGFPEEVEHISAFPDVTPAVPAMRSVGYSG